MKQLSRDNDNDDGSDLSQLRRSEGSLLNVLDKSRTVEKLCCRHQLSCKFPQENLSIWAAKVFRHNPALKLVEWNGVSAEIKSLSTQSVVETGFVMKYV